MNLSNLYENIRTLIGQFVYTKEETNSAIDNRIQYIDEVLVWILEQDIVLKDDVEEILEELLNEEEE